MYRRTRANIGVEIFTNKEKVKNTNRKPDNQTYKQPNSKLKKTSACNKTQLHYFIFEDDI